MAIFEDGEGRARRGDEGDRPGETVESGLITPSTALVQMGHRDYRDVQPVRHLG
jgi:hypothetical protein